MRSAASWGALAAALALIVIAGRPSPAAPTAGPFPSPVPSSTAQPQTNPFPSPSPTPRSPLGNGYVSAGYVWGSAGGGVIQPLPLSGETPKPFPNSNESGFWLNMVGRLGPSYLATLSYEGYKLFGGDRPYLSFAQLGALYEPGVSRVAVGVGVISVQRSTVSTNMDSFGPWLMLLPDFSSRLSPYGSAFYYPHLHTGGTSSGLIAGQAGFIFVPRPTGGLFVRMGVSGHCCLPAAISPKSDFGTVIGLGTTF